MHQRTWLAILTLPIVTMFAYPIIFESKLYGSKIELWHDVCDPVVGLVEIRHAITSIQKEYVDQPDMDKVISGGIQGILERVHPMNSYLSPEEVKLPSAGFGSVGITAVKSDDYATIIAVMPNSPAARAGLKEGTKILGVDGISVNYMSAWMLNYKLHGLTGSDIEILSVGNDDGIQKKLVLKRESLDGMPITIRSYKYATIISLPDLSLGRFNELKFKISDMSRKLPIILDLRHCVGGDLHEAAQVAGLFINNGVLTSIYEANKALITISILHDNNFECFRNVAILQSKCTIGSAEALISALKKRSIPTFGERTCGLGIEKTRFFLKDGSAVELVNKYWIGASGELLGTDTGLYEKKSSCITTKAYPWSSGFGVGPNYVMQADLADNDIIIKVLDVLYTRVTT